MIKLDKKDKRILYELDKNCRQTNSEIAKKVGLSKQVVGFRIQRLIENKIISFFYAIIDISKLGFAIHKNFLRFQNMTKEKEKAFLDYTKSNPNVVWAASCDGRYDFIFSTWAKDAEYLSNILKELNSKFGQFIYDRQTATILKGQYFPRDYLLDKKRTEINPEAFFGSVPKQIKIDEEDWKIILALGKDARTTAVDISKGMKLSADAIGDRIRKLEKLGVIKSYTIVPNEAQYPYLHHKVLISLKNNSDEVEKGLVNFCQDNPNIVYLVKTLGHWDFEIDIEAENIEKLREVLMELKSKFQNEIKDYSSLQIYQVHKYNFCPSIPK